MKFKVLTIGWEPAFIEYLLPPIEKLVEIEFVHGLTGDASRVRYAQNHFPNRKFVALSKKNTEPLPAPDYSLLASLECTGVPTVRSMVQGDRVLRCRSENETFGYATLLAKKIRGALEELRPDAVLASLDSLHSAMSLAVAKSIGIPWVALTFPVIPDNLTGFCNGLTQDSLVPLTRSLDDQLRSDARTLIDNVRRRKQIVAAYKAPVSLGQWLRQYLLHIRNLLRRGEGAKVLGIDRFTYPSVGERILDVVRRSYNSLRLPAGNMLLEPPDGPFIYYPFHMTPESSLDTWAPYYQNQLAFLAQVSLAIPSDMVFVVKLHFSDPNNYNRSELRKLMKLPRLRIAHPNVSGRVFSERASLMLGITGTSCLEAALYGTPVLIFGDSPYQHFPRTERARRPDELRGQIRRLLDMPRPSDHEIVEAYATYLARYMPGRFNDWTTPLKPGESERLANCFRALQTYICDPGNRTNWYNRPPFVAANSAY